MTFEELVWSAQPTTYYGRRSSRVSKADALCFIRECDEPGQYTVLEVRARAPGSKYIPTELYDMHLLQLVAWLDDAEPAP